MAVDGYKFPINSTAQAFPAVLHSLFIQKSKHFTNLC